MARRGPKPKPLVAIQDGPAAMPRCPGHLSTEARNEWRRLARSLHGLGLLTVADRTALAAYCQAYGRWVEAEEKLRETPMLLKTPSGYVQQSPWLSISNKQLEIMGRYMAELGLTPVARTRLRLEAAQPADKITKVELVVVSTDKEGTRHEKPFGPPEREKPEAKTITYELDDRL